MQEKNKPTILRLELTCGENTLVDTLRELANIIEENPYYNKLKSKSYAISRGLFFARVRPMEKVLKELDEEIELIKGITNKN